MIHARHELKPFEVADIVSLIRWIPSPSFLLQWGGPEFTYPLTYRQYKSHLDSICLAGGRAYVLQDIEETPIGCGEISPVNSKNRSCSLRRLFVWRPENRGQGLGKYLVHSLLRIAFCELGVHRVTLNVLEPNTTAIRCYRKCGFVQEGILRESRFDGTQYINLVVMGLLRSEWVDTSVQ